MHQHIDRLPDSSSIQFNVSRLLKSEIGQSRAYDFASSDPIDLEDGVATDIHGHVKFMLTNFGIVASGHAEATLMLNCARCLEPFQTSTAVDFEEEFQPAIDITTGLPAKTPLSDTAFVISQSHTLDLTEPIRQNLVVAVDLIPVCSADCKGLCPTCGANRNLETCHCHEPDNSSPFAVLQELLSESKPQS